MLCLQAAGTASHIHNGDACGIINIDFRLAHQIARAPQRIPVLVTHLAYAQTLTVNACLGAQHTVNQLLLAHFQAEEGHAARLAANLFMRTQSNVLHNVQRQRRFTHGRTRRQNNKVRRMQTARQLVEVGKA